MFELLIGKDLIALYIGLGTVIGSIVGGFLSSLIVRSHKNSTFCQD
jgi:hypothetical protein